MLLSVPGCFQLMESEERQARSVLSAQFGLAGRGDERLTLLGKGSEGIVLRGNCWVYKWFRAPSIELYATLVALAERIGCRPAEQWRSLFQFDVTLANCDWRGDVCIRYRFFESEPYIGGYESEFAYFIGELAACGFAMTNIKPENFRVSSSKAVTCIDLGSSIVPLSRPFFESTCRRAFIVVRMPFHERFKEFCRATNDDNRFEFLQGHISSPATFRDEYARFRKLCGARLDQCRRELAVHAEVSSQDLRQQL